MRSSEVQIQVDPSHYDNMNYDSLKRFCSYWHQIYEVISLKPENVLEIGIGNGFVSNYLRKIGLKVTTCDIDYKLNPDIIASVTDLPIDDNRFDVVACFEVLEHIPFPEVYNAIKELARVSKNKVLISVPDSSRRYQFLSQVPKMGVLKFLIPLPRLINKVHVFDGEHYWELSKKGYSLKKFIKLINHCGLEIEKNYRIFENPFHRMFICNI